MKTLYPISISLLVLFLILLNTSAIYSQTTIGVGLSVQKPLSSTWLGYNGQSTVRNGESWVEPNLKGKVPLLKPKVLRYPAGGIGNFWDWKRGWFIDAPYLPSTFSGLTRQPNYLENFKIVMDSCHADAVFMLNMVTSTLPYQIAMLKHADSIGIPIKFVELGNEFFLSADDEDADPCTRFVDSVFHYVRPYALMCNAWIDTIHHYYPNAKVAVQGCFEKNLKPKRVKWNDSMNAVLNHHEDAWSIHSYFGSAWVDSTETTADKQVETIDEVPDWMYQPYKMWNTLVNTTLYKVPAGKDIWITEYNMTDHDRPVHGTWGHGLYLPLQTMQFLNDPRIKLLTCHAMDGSALYGQYYFATNGFNFGGEDGSWTSPQNPPTTTYWGMTATGNTMKMLGESASGKTNASPLVFTPSTSITVTENFGTKTYTYDGVYGWLFNNSTGSDAVILNLSGTTYTLTTNVLFPSGGTYTEKYTDPLKPIGNSSTDITSVSGNLPATLTLQPYSAVKITSSFVPAAAPTVHITVNGSLSICNKDSVQFDAGAGYNSYVWSNGATTRTIYGKTTGTYWVHAYAVASGYYGCDSVHLVVNALPNRPNILPAQSRTFCDGGSVQFVPQIVNPPAGLAYLWNTGATTQNYTATLQGNYWLTITDLNGCKSVSDTEFVTVYQLPHPTITAGGPTSFCYDQSVTLSAPAGYTNYAWSPSGFGQTKVVSTAGNYSCTVTDGHGCVGAAANSISVTVYDLPIPTINMVNGGITFCTGAPVYMTTQSGYNYQWQMNTSNLSGATQQNYTPTANGPYRIVTTDSHGCSRVSLPTNITINLLPTPNITVTGGISICQGTTSVLNSNNTYSAYLWSTGQTTSSITVGTTSNYLMTVTDANGCTATASKTITVNPLPTPTITAGGPTNFCSGGSVTLTVTTTYTAYNWSNGTVGQSKSFSTDGTYFCTVTDNNSCTGASNSITVTTHSVPLPPITTSTGQTTFCSNSGVYLTTSTTGYNYQWQLAGAAVSGATNQNYIPAAGGSYRILLTDAWGCTNRSNALSVTRNVAPNPSITGNAGICQGQSTSLSANTTYNGYSWSTGATTQSISASTAGTYTLTVTDANSCTGTATKTTNINSLPTPTISAGGATSFCSGGSVTLNVTNTYNSYLWTGGSTQQSKSFSASGAYSCTVTDANGCAGTSNAITLDVHTLPVPVVATSSGPATFCSNSGVYLTTSTTGYAYSWFKGSVLQTGETNQNYNPTASGTYKVQITDGLGCTSIASGLAITYNVAPTVSVTGNGTICPGQSSTLSASAAFPTYIWSNGATTQSITTSTPATYTITVTDANSCTGSANKVLAYGSTLFPTISASGATEFCSGSVNLNVTAAYTSYHWSNSITTQTITASSSGTYSCTVTDAQGCTGVSNAITVNAHELPTVGINTSTGALTFCSNSGVYLTTPNNGYNYAWIKGGTVQSGATNQNYTPPSSATYKVTITDAFGCSKTSSGLAVTVNAAPAPTITGNSSVCSGHSTTLSANTTYTTYLWSTGATVQSITTSTAATYTLTVTNSTGCSGTAPTVTTVVHSNPTATITSTGATNFCDGGNDTLKANTASSYLWSDGKTSQANAVTASGTFTVTITDAFGCTGVSTPTTINEWIIPEPTVTAVGPTTYCTGATGSSLNTISGSGYAYQWMKGTAAQNGATNQSYSPTKSGTWKCKITESHNCSRTSATGVKITVNALPTASVTITGNTNNCGGATATLKETVGTGNLYQWKNASGNISGATGSQYVTGAAGVYSCVVTSNKGCTATSNSITLTNNCKMGESANSEEASIELYPNPATNNVTIEAQFASQISGTASLEIRNVLGEIVYSEKQEIEGGKFSTSVLFDHRFSNGSYFTRISFNDERVTKQFIITDSGR